MKSCKSCIHRRTVVSLFDTGQMRETFDCAHLVWPGPVSPESFYTHPKTFLDRARDCLHYVLGRASDLVKNEIE